MRYESVVIDQGGAGTTVLRAAPQPENAIHLVNYVVVMSSSGTFAFSDGTDWLSGDVPATTNGGVSASADNAEAPLMICGKGRPLQITTTGGSAHGHALIAIY